MDEEKLGSTAMDFEHPWPGLYAYTEDQCAFFFGRESETHQLLRRVEKRVITILFGKSGLGKSSLLQAGLFPKLRAIGFRPIPIRFTFGKDLGTQGHHGGLIGIREQTRRAIASELFPVPEALGLSDRDERWEFTQRFAKFLPAGKHEFPVPPRSDESLWEYFHRGGGGFADENGTPFIPTLVFDQFEELFTRGRETLGGREEVNAFLRELADLVEDRSPEGFSRGDEQDSCPRYRVLLSQREEFIADLESWRKEMPSLMENRMRLRELDGEAALRAVTCPAALRPGLPPIVSDEISFRLVRALAGDGDETDRSKSGAGGANSFRDLIIDPALLSLVLRELNETRCQQSLAFITESLVKERGDIRGILKAFYKEIIAEEHSAVRVLLESELITEGGFRDSINEERAKDYLRHEKADPDALTRLVDRRLLRVEERIDQRRLELAHDLLCGILNESAQERLADEKIQIDRQRKLAEFAAGERRRAEAESAQRRAESALVEQTRARTEAEALRTTAERESYRAKRWTSVAMIVAIAAVGLLIYALAQKRIADDKTSETERQKRLADVSAALAVAKAAETETEKAKAEALAQELSRTSRNLNQSLEKIQIENNTTKKRISEAETTMAQMLDTLENDLIPKISVMKQPLAEEFRNLVLKADPSRKSHAILRPAPVINDSERQRTDALTSDQNGDGLLNQKKYGEALGAYRRSLEIREKLAKDNPENEDIRLELSVSYNNIGNVLLSENDAAGALREYKEALEIREKLAETSKVNDPKWQRAVYFSLLNISDVFVKKQDYDAAISNAQAAAKIADDMVQRDASNPTWHNDLKSANDEVDLLKSLKSSATKRSNK